jgi:hypothetical protein
VQSGKDHNHDEHCGQRHDGEFLGVRDEYFHPIPLRRKTATRAGPATAITIHAMLTVSRHVVSSFAPRGLQERKTQTRSPRWSLVARIANGPTSACRSDAYILKRLCPQLALASFQPYIWRRLAA